MNRNESYKQYKIYVDILDLIYVDKYVVFWVKCFISAYTNLSVPFSSRTFNLLRNLEEIK